MRSRTGLSDLLGKVIGVVNVRVKNTKKECGMIIRFAAVLLVAGLLSGCVFYQTGIVSKDGKAYLIRTRPAAPEQDLLHCDASGSRPVCTVQAEN